MPDVNTFYGKHFQGRYQMKHQHYLGNIYIVISGLYLWPF